MTNGDAEPSIPPALAATVALAVAGLGVIGLTGEPLLRAIRNHPVLLGLALIVAVIAGGLFTVLRLTKHPHASLVGLGVLILSIAGLIGLGAWAQSEDELPTVTLQVGPPIAAPSALTTKSLQNGVTELTLVARSASLKTDEDLTVQVLGLIEYDGVSKRAVQLCENGGYSWNNSKPSKETSPGPPAREATLLFWNRVGPRADGTIDATWKLQIPTGTFAGVCASAFGDSNSAAYLRLPPP